MILTVGSSYIHRATGNTYRITTISHIKIDKWKSDGAITYTDGVNFYTRLRDDFISRFEYSRFQDAPQS